MLADETFHCGTEDVVKQTDQDGDAYRNADDDERVRNRRPVGRPDDVGELFAHMLQIGEG